MKDVYLTFFALSLVFGVGVSLAQERGTGGKADNRIISSIRTAGNRSVSSSAILAKVRSRVGQLFDSEMAAEDAKRVAELSGVGYCYYNTAVVDDKVQLTFVVVEKNIVRSIVFSGNLEYKDRTLQKKVDLKLGDYLDPLIAETGRKNIVDFYHKKGFAFVSVVLDREKLSSGKVLYTINEGPRVRIVSVRFSGNSAVKTKELRSVVKTKKSKFFVFPRYYVDEKVTADVTRLENAYYERGFLDAKVKLTKEFSKDRRKVWITFNINEGTVYTVEKILITGNKYFEEQKLRSELGFTVGTVYNERKAKAAAKQLLKSYHEVGFIDAKVSQNLRFVSAQSVVVEYAITEGERFRIGRINITGNEQTQDRVIRRILDEYDFQPGDWYNADLARGDGSGYLEKLIRRSIYAETATVTPSGKKPEVRDAQVNVAEGRTGAVLLGAGVSTDSGVIGQLVFNQRNFDISDWPESFGEFIKGEAFKGAGQNLRIALEPGTQVSQYSVSFREPYFQDKPTSLEVTGSSYERGRESFDEKRQRGYVEFEKRFKNRWRRRLSFRAENVDVGDVDLGAPTEIKDVQGNNALFGIGVGIGRDMRDDKFTPSKGYAFDAGYEQVGGDFTFGILTGTYRRYTTLYEDLAERKTILATKLHAATTVGDAPPFEKFYAGGQGSLRGFDYRGVSTRGRNTLTGKVDDPIGSDWIFLANAEVTVPLARESINGLFFVDSGTIDSGGYRAAVGTGIEILIPQWFGPVPMRFEIAAPVMKDDEDETQVFSFSVGRLF